MQKNVSIKGFCPFLDEDVTINASLFYLTNICYRVLGSSDYATPKENLCNHRFECGRGADPNNCPIFDQVFLWNKL